MSLGMERNYAKRQAIKLGQPLEDVLGHRAAGEHWCNAGKHWSTKRDFDVLSSLKPCANCREHNNLHRAKKVGAL